MKLHELYIRDIIINLSNVDMFLKDKGYFLGFYYYHLIVWMSGKKHVIDCETEDSLNVEYNRLKEAMQQ